MKNIAFMFGAGAEGKGNFDFPMGEDLLLDTFYNHKKTKLIVDCLKEFFDGEYFIGFYKERYYRYRRERFLNYRKATGDLRNKEFAKLDGYFNSIVNPMLLGTNKYSMVVNYYWCCYFFMIESIINGLKKKDVDDLHEYYIMENNGKWYLDYIKILNNIFDFTCELYKITYPQNQNSYYDLILSECNKRSNDICYKGCITTNYFNLSKIILKGDVAYLNGKLSMFEFPEIMKIIDLDDANKEIQKELFSGEKMFFPFIFGQSYIKPIISPSQIEQFDIMNKILEKSDVLIILGYGINSYDNHVNSFIDDYIDKGKTVFWVESKSDSGNIKNGYIGYLKNKTKPIYVDYNDDNSIIVEKVFNSIVN